MKRVTFSLRNAVVILVAGPLLAAALLLGGVGYRLLRDVVTHFHGAFVSNIFVSAAEAVEGHFGNGVRFLREFTLRFHAAPETPEEREQLGRFFAERLRYQPAIQWISFGSARDGLFVGARRGTGGRILLNISHPNEHGGLPREWSLAEDGRLIPESTSALQPYDPRTRPWYQMAVATNHAVWTPLYEFHEGATGVTCASACRDERGNVVGVFTVDFLADRVMDYLGELHVGKSGFVFLYNTTGSFVAPHRLSALQQATLRAAMRSPAPAPGHRESDLGTPLQQDGETYLVARRELTPARPTGWWCGVLVPEKEIWGTLDQIVMWNSLIALGLISLALLLATLAAAAASRRIDRACRDLTHTGAGDVIADSGLPPSHVREIATLQHAVQDFQRLLHLWQAQEHARLVAEAASQAKSEALAMVSHDLRSPLQSVIGYADLLNQGAELKVAEREQALGAITIASRTMLQLVTNYLNLRSLNEGRLTVCPTPVEIEPLCHECALLIQGLALDKTVTVHVETDPATGTMETDREKLQQILINVLGNAVKFTHAGQVTLRTERLDGTVQFRITDTGIGMTPEQTSLVFEAFRQADPTITAKYGGSGLGLTIAKRLTELLGGRLRLESALGRGTQVTIELPLQAPAHQTFLPVT